MSYCFSRSSVNFQGQVGQKITNFDPNWAFPDCNSSLNIPMALKCCTKPNVVQKRCFIVFSCNQAALLRMFQSVRPSVRLSVTPFWYSPLGEYYCHRHSSDSFRRDFDLVPLICRLWNALSTSGSSVQVYRFSTIFATDGVWFGCMSMYSSWKRQLLLAPLRMRSGANLILSQMSCGTVCCVLSQWHSNCDCGTVIPDSWLYGCQLV